MLTLLSVEATRLHRVGVLACAPWSQRGWNLAAGAVAGIATALITAPHWLIFLEALRDAVTAYDAAPVFTGGVRQAAGFFLGPLANGTLVNRCSFARPGTAHCSSRLGAKKSRRRRDRRCRSPAGFTSCALLAIAFGALPESWVKQVPPDQRASLISLTRYPPRPSRF